MKLLWLLLFPAVVWAWGAPQPPPHVIELKSKPHDQRPHVPVTNEELRESQQSPQDEYRYDVPPNKKTQEKKD